MTIIRSAIPGKGMTLCDGTVVHDAEELAYWFLVTNADLKILLLRDLLMEYGDVVRDGGLK